MTEEESQDAAPPVEPEPSEPEATEPEATEPEATEPEAAEPAPPARSAAAVRMIRSLPLLSELPGWAALLLVAGLASLALILLLQVFELGIVVLYQGLGGLLSVLLVSFVLAYLLDPVIDRFERAGWDRSVGIAIALSLFLAVDAVLLLLTVPYVVTEVSDLGDNMDGYLEGAAANVTRLETWVKEQTGTSIDLRFTTMKKRLPELLGRVSLDGIDPLRVFTGKLLGSTLGLLGTLIQWSFLPIFAFFFLRDFDTMKRRLFGLVPFRWRQLTLDNYLEIDARMSRFVRGQLIVSAILAVLYALGLSLFTSIDLAVLVGVVAGLLFVVPYFGTFLGVLAGSVLAFLKFGVDVEILKVWAVFGVVQVIEGVLLTPKIVGDSVGLHPVIVLLALVAGGNLFGFLGILLAVPLAAAAQVLLGAFVSYYQDTSWFLEGEAAAPGVDELP